MAPSLSRRRGRNCKKVHWPSRKETYAATLVVIVVVFLISAYLAMVDLALTKAIQAIIG